MFIGGNIMASTTKLKLSNGDIILEQVIKPSSEVWCYRKYKSGFVELWLKSWMSSVTTSQVGTWWATDVKIYKFPFKVYNNVPFMSAKNELYIPNIVGSTDDDVSVRLFRFSQYQEEWNLNINLYLVGTYLKL